VVTCSIMSYMFVLLYEKKIVIELVDIKKLLSI